MNAGILKTIRAWILGFGMHIPELLAQRKFVSTGCNAHSDAQKPPKPVALIVLMLEYQF